ncbi:MAG: Mur ligase family protein, partial [Syntrophobacterales bacterium]
MENLDNKKVLVVGLARTGLAVAEFLLDQGARVTITDHLPAEDLGSEAESASRLGCSLALGGHPAELFTDADLIVVSPGVPLNIPQLQEARSKSVPIIGELELASRFLKLPILAISGTNGKTTTTELVGDMFNHSGQRAFVGGNIGNPLVNLAR